MALAGRLSLVLHGGRLLQRDGIAGDQRLRDLDGVRPRAFAQVVHRGPEPEPVARQVAADESALRRCTLSPLRSSVVFLTPSGPALIWLTRIDHRGVQFDVI